MKSFITALILLPITFITYPAHTNPVTPNYTDPESGIAYFDVMKSIDARTPDDKWVKYWNTRSLPDKFRMQLHANVRQNVPLELGLFRISKRYMNSDAEIDAIIGNNMIDKSKHYNTPGFFQRRTTGNTLRVWSTDLFRRLHFRIQKWETERSR